MKTVDIRIFVDRIKRALNFAKIKHEVLGDAYSFLLAPTCTIYTDHCTIEIHKNDIRVNEVAVADIDEMIVAIQKVETA